MPTKRKLAVLLIKDKQIIISHFYLINIHIFDYPDSRLSGLFTEVPMSPDNRGSTVISRGRLRVKSQYTLHAYSLTNSNSIKTILVTCSYGIPFYTCCRLSQDSLNLLKRQVCPLWCSCVNMASFLGGRCAYSLSFMNFLLVAYPATNVQ